MSKKSRASGIFLCVREGNVPFFQKYVYKSQNV